MYNLAPGILCLLCGVCLETHTHLFYDCPATRFVWTSILQKGGFHIPSLPWQELISWMSSNWRGNSFVNITKKMCLAISVYYIWKERNTRFHTNSTSTYDEILSTIVEHIRLKLSTFKNVKDNISNRQCQSCWNLSDKIFDPL